MNSIKYFIFCFTSIIILASCGATKKTPVSNPDAFPAKVEGCNTTVMVKNYTHLTDCQYLLKTMDGKLLYPAELPTTQAAFYEGAGLKIGYELIELGKNDVAKVQCTEHDYLVRVTCIEQTVIKEDGLPDNHEDCISIKNPYKFTWMRNAITEHNPVRVNEYPYTIGFMYEFKTENSSLLYDCLGNKVCDTADNEDCKSILSTLSKPKVLLVVNN